MLQVANVLLKLVHAYFQFEAITAEINPLIFSREGRGLFAADAKSEIDDSALGRVKEIGAFTRSEKGTDPLEREAQKRISPTCGCLAAISASSPAARDWGWRPWI